MSRRSPQCGCGSGSPKGPARGPPPGSRCRSSSSRPHTPVGAPSTLLTSSLWSAPAPGSRRANSSKDRTNQDAISKSRDCRPTELVHSECIWPLCDLVRESGWGLSQIAEEGPDVVGEQLRLLESGEMSSPSGDIGPDGDVVGLFGEATDTNVVSVHDGAGRHARGLSGWPPLRLGITDIGRRPSGGGEPIDHDVGQQPIAIDDRIRQAVWRVCPGAELVHDPGELADR